MWLQVRLQRPTSEWILYTFRNTVGLVNAASTFSTTTEHTDDAKIRRQRAVQQCRLCIFTNMHNDGGLFHHLLNRALQQTEIVIWRECRRNVGGRSSCPYFWVKWWIMVHNKCECMLHCIHIPFLFSLSNAGCRKDYIIWKAMFNILSSFPYFYTFLTKKE